MSNFPKYMKSKSGKVVCFSSPKIGMCVYPNVWYSVNWNMEYFTDCEDQLNPIPLTIERQAEKVLGYLDEDKGITEFGKDVKTLCNLILKK